MKKFVRLTLFTSLSMLSAHSFADVLTDSCDSCHGAGGNSSNDAVPSIAGNAAVYISDSLIAFKEGRPASSFKPEGGEESDMMAIAKKLSDADIEKVATHYAGMEYKIASRSVDSAKAAAGKKVFAKRCDACHAEGGSDPADEAGLLLGQSKAYLSQQFAYFDKGERDIPKKMKKKLKKISAADKENIIEYLASGAK